MEEIIQLVAKTYGIAGIIILTPTAGCVFLWRHYVAKEKEWRAEQKEWRVERDALVNRIETAHSKRIDDVKALGEGLRAIASEQSGLNKETNLALERINETMASLQAVVTATHR